MNKKSIEKYYLERIPYPKDYEPTSWVKSVVGNKYKSNDKVWICIGYDPGCGFWMENIEDSNELAKFQEKGLLKLVKSYHRRKFKGKCKQKL